MIAGKLSTSNEPVTTFAARALRRKDNTRSNIMTFSESVQHFIKVSSISPTRLNSIFDPVGIYTRGCNCRHRRAWQHSCSKFKCPDSQERICHNCRNGSSNGLCSSDKSKSIEQQHRTDVSILENDDRFCEVDGFFIVSNAPDQSKLKSIINNRLDACRSFLNLFDVRRHSNDDALLNKRKTQHMVSNTLPDERRHSSNEFASRIEQPCRTNHLASFKQESFRNDDENSIKSILNLFEVRKPSNLNKPDSLLSICEREQQSQNDITTLKSKVIDPSCIRRNSSFGTKQLKRKDQNTPNSSKRISPVPRLFEPIVIDRKKGEVIS